MSVHYVYKVDGGAKFMRPIHTREEYLALRNGGEQIPYMKRIRNGEEKLKNQLVEMNYSCLPNEDGSLKGSRTMSTTVGMDIDFVAPQELAAEERQAWLSKRMAEVPELVLGKKEELGLLMLERSATKGYHLVFRRQTELSQEANLKWASDLLGVAFDKQAKDITRVFFSTTGSKEDLVFLDDGVFEISPCATSPSVIPSAVEGSPHDKPYPQDYNGTPYADIIAKYWELFNNGHQPVEGDRNALTFELAVTIRCICGYSLERLMQVVPNDWAKPEDGIHPASAGQGHLLGQHRVPHAHPEHRVDRLVAQWPAVGNQRAQPAHGGP